MCRCRASRLLRPSLSFPRNFHVGGRRKIHPPLKRLYTHLLASICKSNLLSFNHRLLDGSGSVKGWASASVLTIDRIKSLSSRRTPLNLHEPSISTNEKPWSNERKKKKKKKKKRKKKIGHNRGRWRRSGEDREDESEGYESRGQKRGGGKHPRRKDERDLKNLDVRHYRCWIPFERTTSSSLLSLLMRPAFSFPLAPTLLALALVSFF